SRPERDATPDLAAERIEGEGAGPVAAAVSEYTVTAADEGVAAGRHEDGSGREEVGVLRQHVASERAGQARDQFPVDEAHRAVGAKLREADEGLALKIDQSLPVAIGRDADG